MDNRIKAIDTVYAGYKFRSRLEARWAVFFDMLGLKYEYEKEGFDLGALGGYLPDFWLPQVNTWAEVKPGPFAPEEVQKCRALARHTMHACLMLEGLPDYREYYCVEEWQSDDGAWQEGESLTPCVIDTSYLHEHRFFVWAGIEAEPDPDNGLFDATYHRAVDAARQARFEFGEHGTPRVAPPPPPPATRPLIPRWQLMNAAPKPEDK